MRNVPRGVKEATSEASGGRNRHTQCCSKVGLKRGPWTPEEDALLADYVRREGEGRWRTLPNKAGLLRWGKSCRLRWMNYLRPDVKRGKIAPDEEEMILRLHRLLGNRWSLIAGRIPGRTDNEIKNYWNTHLSKKLISQGLDPRTHKPLQDAITAAAPPPPPNPNPNSFSANSYGQQLNNLSGNNFMRTPFPYTPVSSIPLEYHTAVDETLHHHHHYMPHGPDHGPSNQQTVMAMTVDGDRAQKINQVVNHGTAAHETLHRHHRDMPQGHDQRPSNQETMMAMAVDADRAQKNDKLVNHGHDDDDDAFSSFLNSLINDDEYVYNHVIKALDPRPSIDGDKETGNHCLSNQFHAPF